MAGNFVGVKLNEAQAKKLQALEDILASLQPSKPWDRSKTIKEAVSIALFHLQNTYFYKAGLTKPSKKPRAEPKKVFVERVPSSELDIYGRRKPRTS